MLFLTRALAIAASIALALAPIAAQAAGQLPAPVFQSSTITESLGYTPLNPADNLSDLPSPSAARAHLGIGASGNTSVYATVSGALTSGHCAQVDANGNLVDSGAACGPPSGSVTASDLDPQAVTAVQMSPYFCHYPDLNGVTDNTECMQEAINYACATASGPAGYAGGGYLIAARAPYHYTALTVPASCSGLTIMGQGFGSSAATYFITDNDCTGPGIYFYPTAVENYVYGGGLYQLYLFNNTLTGGAFDGSTSCKNPLIQVNYGRNMRFDRIETLSPYVLFKVIGGSTIIITDIAGDQVLPDSPGVFDFSGSGAHADTTGQLTRQDLVRLNWVTMFGATPAATHYYPNGIYWHGLSQTLTVNNAAFESFTTAFKVDCNNYGIAALDIGACPGTGKINDLETECAGADCLDITDAEYIDFDDLYAAAFAETSTATPATSGANEIVHVYNTSFNDTGEITINGGQISGAQSDGLDFEGHQLAVVGGVHFYGNNAANVGAADIAIQSPVGSNASGSHIIEGDFFCEGPSGNSLSEAPLSIGSGNDYITYEGNNLKTCWTALVGSVGSHGVNGPNAGP